MLQASFIAPHTLITAKGDSDAVEVSGSANRVFLISLNIEKVVEQESFELSIFSSVDGQTWGAKPIMTFPQKFYVGETPGLLDLTAHPDVKFVRAHWEVNRWGRGSEAPSFEVGVTLKEVPAGMMQELKK